MESFTRVICSEPLVIEASSFACISRGEQLKASLIYGVHNEGIHIFKCRDLFIYADHPNGFLITYKKIKNLIEQNMLEARFFNVDILVRLNEINE